MKFLKQILIILAINFTGELLSHSLNLPLPGSITGMLLLLILLFTGLIKEKHIAETSDFFLNNMGFFFIPAGVSIMISYYSLKGNYIQTLLVILLSTLLVLAVSAVATQFLIHRKEKENGKAH
ncbi:MAG: CidA/LrgA family protein [Prolixibacteraceae bacterium]